MKIETTRKRMVMFSTISLTDIVLLLLIFFLLTSSFVVQPGIKVKLPRAGSGQPEDADKIYLTITEKELIYLNQQRIDIKDLGQQLRILLAEKSGQVVVIRADKDLTLEATIRVIDLAKLAGAERFMIATDPNL